MFCFFLFFFIYSCYFSFEANTHTTFFNQYLCPPMNGEVFALSTSLFFCGTPSYVYSLNEFFIFNFLFPPPRENPAHLFTLNNTQEIALLKKEKKDLTNQIKLLNISQDGGGEVQVLGNLIAKLSTINGHLNEEWTGRKGVPINSTEMDRLILLWADQKNSQKFNYRLGEILPVMDTELRQRNRQMKGVKNLDDETKYFLAEKDGEGGYTHPVWKTFEGNREITTGIKSESQYSHELEPASLSTKMLAMYDYILCAAGQNETNFSFPDQFRTHKDSPKPDVLSDLLITPHLSFCNNCVQQAQTEAFKLLCLGSAPENQYGSKMFWIARSKLVPADSIRFLADEFINAQFKKGEKTLAVRLPKGKQWKTMCVDEVQAPQSLLFHRMILSGEDVKEASSDKAQQCNPDLGEAAAVMKDIVEETKATSIFLISDIDEKKAQEVATAVGVPIVSVPLGEMTPAKKAIIDITVASQLDSILVNRFDPMSAHIVEYFMMNKRLSTSNINIW